MLGLSKGSDFTMPTKGDGMSADRARCELLSKLTNMRDWVDRNFTEINETKAYQAHSLLDKVWETLERRRK